MGTESDVTGIHADLHITLTTELAKTIKDEVERDEEMEEKAEEEERMGESKRWFYSAL